MQQLKYTLDLDPNFPGVHEALGIEYTIHGKFDEAIGELEKVRQIVGPNNPFAMGELGYAYAKAGKKDEAMKIANQFVELSKKGYTLSVQTALVYAGLGENDKAIELLEKGYTEQDSYIGYLKINHDWDNLRSDPRYTALLKKIGLEK